MKFKINTLLGFTDVGTVVLYKKRPFYPETIELTDLQKKSILELSVSEEYLFASDEVSEDLDFARYGFSFDLSENDYWSTQLANLYNYQETSDKIGKDYDKIISRFFPQYDPDGERKKKFFGRIESVSGENVTYLVRIPRDVWKLEFYNSKITSNTTIFEKECFIDSDILDKINLPKTNSPFLSVYLGPDYDIQIEDLSYEELMRGEFETYLSRYTVNSNGEGAVILGEQEYNDFTTFKSKRNYLSSCLEEIDSEGILYLCTSSEGTIEELDLLSPSQIESKNKFPKLPENALRKDVQENTTHTIFEETFPGLVIDPRNNTLLGLGEVSEENSQWFHGALRAEPLYSESGKSGKVVVNGKTYLSPSNSGIFGEDPSISPWWYSQEELPVSEFHYYYLTKTGKGEITPGGLFYLKSGLPIIFQTKNTVGYQYEKITHLDQEVPTTSLGNGEFSIKDSGQYEEGSSFNVIFKEIKYPFDLKLTCKKDFYNRENGQASERTYRLLELEFVEGCRILYRLESGETGYFGDEYNINNPLKVCDSCKVYFKLEMGPIYSLSSKITFLNGKEIPKDNEWYVLDVNKFPSNTTKIITAVGEIITNTLTVQILVDSEVQVSTPKKLILQYGDYFETSFKVPSSPNEYVVFILAEDDLEDDWEIITNESEKIITVKKSSGITTNYKINLVRHENSL